MMTLPSFDELPLDKQGPELNAWGLYGKDDELGRLNLITPEVIKRGAETIQLGKVVNLNLPLSLRGTHPARKGLVHTINARGNCVDDHVDFNTQASTQWDGFRHFPYQNWPSQGEHRFYNGQTYEEAIDYKSSRNGTQNFVKRGITSRAHLIDVPSYLKQQNIEPSDPFSAESPISVETLQAAAKAQNTIVEPGDILLVRTGYAEAYISLDDASFKLLQKREKRQSHGLKADRGLMKWLWDSGVAAIAADCPAVEASMRPVGRLVLHEIGLAGWGMPLGEMFDLHELAKECGKIRRWTFLFTSMPLYVEGGIASPPNAQAIL